MKKPLLLLLFFTAAFASVANAQHTKKLLRKTEIDHFFTCTLDQMFDTISVAYNIPIYFERDVLQTMDVTNHFFNESLEDVFKYVCRQNDLQYWIENDGTIYILRKPDDLPRLRQENQLRKTAALVKPVLLEAAKSPPQHFNFAIHGRITDQNTGEALPGATVKIRYADISTVTNTSGYFTILNVPSDTVALDVSFVGYQRDAFRLNSKSRDSTLTFSLFPSMNSLNEVQITDKRNGVLNTDTKKVSVLQLNPTALDKLPNIGERDVMRAFQLMPGVSATNESSSGAYVRGGTPDQNLVTFDGFTVYQVDHLYGFFSAFNSNAVRDVDMYKGGFSAKYGGRLSSVTEIRGKDGNKNETNIGGDLSLLSTNIYAESPVGSKSSALIAFRRSYQGPFYDKIFGQFNTSPTTSFGGAGGGGFGGRGGPGGGFRNQTTPSSYFYDINGKYVYTLSTKNTLALSYYNGHDHLDNSRDMNIPAFGTASSSDINVNDKTLSGNTGAALRWTSTVAPKLLANTVISYSGFFSDRDRTTKGSVTDSGTTTTINSGTLEKNRLRDLSIKSDWEWQATPTVKFLYGGFASQLNIKYNYTQSDTISLISQNNTGTIGGGYTEFEIDPNSKLHLQPGLRTTYFSPDGKIILNPGLT